jgi:hypothetical protein
MRRAWQLACLCGFLLTAGCFDFSLLGPGDLGVPSEGGVGGGGSDPDDGGDPGLPDLTPTCRTYADCANGTNCIGSVCLPAVESCAAHKAAWPQSGDGVYWIGAAGATHLTYCDMQLGAALCSDTRTSHSGKTRDGAKLAFTMNSVLSADGKSCDLWTLRATDGFPLGVVDKTENPSIVLGQCETLGFLGDVSVSQCNYGTASGYSNCGYAVSPLYAYGHRCVMCMLGTGTWSSYTKMGPFTNGATLTSFDDSKRATCRTR